VLPLVAFMKAHRLKHRGKDFKRRGIALEKQIAPQNLGAADVLQSHILKLQRVDTQAPVHIGDIPIALRRPESLR